MLSGHHAFNEPTGAADYAPLNPPYELRATVSPETRFENNLSIPGLTFRAISDPAISEDCLPCQFGFVRLDHLGASQIVVHSSTSAR